MLLNKACTRRYILQRCKRFKTGPYERVSEHSYVLLEARLKRVIDDAIQRMGSRTRTVRFEDVLI